MKSTPTPDISLETLLQLLVESGFEIVLKPESALLAQSAKPRVRARTVQAEAKIKGLIVPDENVILINRDLTKQERVITAIHELIHLHSPSLSEKATEREAQRLYAKLDARDLGYLEFLVS